MINATMTVLIVFTVTAAGEQYDVIIYDLRR